MLKKKREKKIGHQTRKSSPSPTSPSPESNLVRWGWEYCTLAAICAVHFQIIFSFCGVEEYLQQQKKIWNSNAAVVELRHQMQSKAHMYLWVDIFSDSTWKVKNVLLLQEWLQKWLHALLYEIQEQGMKSYILYPVYPALAIDCNWLFVSLCGWPTRQGCNLTLTTRSTVKDPDCRKSACLWCLMHGGGKRKKQLCLIAWKTNSVVSSSGKHQDFSVHSFVLKGQWQYWEMQKLHLNGVHYKAGQDISVFVTNVTWVQLFLWKCECSTGCSYSLGHLVMFFWPEDMKMYSQKWCGNTKCLMHCCKPQKH